MRKRVQAEVGRRCDYIYPVAEATAKSQELQQAGFARAREILSVGVLRVKTREGWTRESILPFVFSLGVLYVCLLAEVTREREVESLRVSETEEKG